MFLEPGLEGAGSFTDVVVGAIVALYMVDSSTLLKGVGVIFNMGQLVA